MAERYIIGVDGGTESLRAGVFNLAGGLVSTFSSPYDTHFPHPSWAEQTPSDWWRALGTAVKGAVAGAGIKPEQVLSIGLDTTCCTVVPLDAEGHALRPALLWMDMRSAKQAALVAACTGDPALKVNGGGAGPVSAEWMIPKSLWLKLNEPHIYDAATYICEYQDYINFWLTGRMCASINNASVRWHYSSETGFPTSLLATLGISDLVSKWPQEVLPLGAYVGGLTAAAAEHLGLPVGTIVAQGGADSFIGMIGLGVIHAGQMALITGSSHLQLGLVDHELHGKGIFGTYTDALLPGLHVVEGGQTSTGSVVNWFKTKLVDPATTYYELNQEAENVPPGCEGLVCLDHFQGNRTPHTDPLSRGSLVGLTLKHGRGHIFRALMESVAFGTELILDTMRTNGFSVDQIVIAGGSTRSDLWMRLHADISNIPFVLTKNIEAPMLGCAVLAAVCANLYPDVASAVDAMVHVDRVVSPNREIHMQYAQPYKRYKALYPSLMSIFHSEVSPASAVAAVAAKQVPQPSGKPRGIISASILAADFANLSQEVECVIASGSDWIHVDMFDGTYVDNFTIGPPVVSSLRKSHPAAFLDCHLAVNDPGKYVEQLHRSGASSVTFHIEVLSDESAASELAKRVRSLGMRVAVALAPETKASRVYSLLQDGLVDMVLCMTVTPGFGGQAMLPEVLDKVKQLRDWFPNMDLQVDGGVNASTAPTAVAAGANVLVAGSAIFGRPNDKPAPKYSVALASISSAFQQLR